MTERGSDDESVEEAGSQDAPVVTQSRRPQRKPWRGYLNRVTLRAVMVLALTLFAVVMTRINDADQSGLAGFIVGVALIGSAVSDATARLGGTTTRRPAWQTWSMAALQIVVGFTMISARNSAEIVALLVGCVLFVSGLLSIGRGLVKRRIARADRSMAAFTGIFQLLLAVIVFLFPLQATTLLVSSIAIWWVTQGVISVIDQYQLDTGRSAHTVDEQQNNPTDTGQVILRWLINHSKNDKSRVELIPKIFYEGAVRSTRLQRFAVLMFLSTTIATLGLISNSTAVVIGAMLIAPLMTPIMGMSAGLISAWPRRVSASALIITCGALGAITVSYLLATLVVDVPAAVLQNSEITSRTQPTLVDLGIALAAGAAGAFALSRPDVSDSLPGAAVAIALVPPLATVGVTLQAGSLSDAGGALLLFLTNLVGILIAGSFVFVLLGVAPLGRAQQQNRLVKTSFAVVGISLAIIALPLAYTGTAIASAQLTQQEAESVTEDWISDSPEFATVSVDVEGNDVSVVLLGNGSPPSPQDLAKQLASALNQQVDVTVSVVPEQQYSASAST